MVTKQSKPTDANYDDDDNNYDIFYSENPVVIKAPTIVNNNCYDGEAAHRDITRFSARIIHFYRKRNVPVQLAQCWFPRLAISMLKYKYIYQIKYTEAILSNSTRKLLWFEISKMPIAVLRNKFIVSFICRVK